MSTYQRPSEDQLNAWRQMFSEFLRPYVWTALECDPFDSSWIYQPRLKAHCLHNILRIPIPGQIEMEECEIDYVPGNDEGYTGYVSLDWNERLSLEIFWGSPFQNEQEVREFCEGIAEQLRLDSRIKYNRAVRLLKQSVEMAKSLPELKDLETAFLNLDDKIEIFAAIEAKKERMGK